MTVTPQAESEPAGKALIALVDGQRAGLVVERRDGRIELTYDEVWQNNLTATPLSLAMPLTGSSYGDDAVRPILWGLLPDNEHVLERWARRFQVSARNPFALLRHVGEDCAGAVQFVAPERVDAMLAGKGGVEWLDDADIAELLRDLRRDPTAWHAGGFGQFSLAGAQAKTALHYDVDANRWGVPWGSVPTTHILKPAIAGLDDHDLNEHLCLEAARLLGLNTAISAVQTFGEDRAIVVARYDRARDRAGRVWRVHQEDVCQALALPPTAKYQNEGGPTPEQIVGLLHREIGPPEVGAENIARFADALAFNWIVGGTDAHAKNYSLLLAGGQVRLAPLYDLASALPYDDMYVPKLRMAMRIGGEYRLASVRGRHWRRFAETNSLEPGAVIARIDDLAMRTPDALATATKADAVRSLDSDLPARLLDLVSAHAGRCRDALAE